MNRRRTDMVLLLAGVLAASVLVVRMARGQGTQGKTPLTTSQVVLAQWNQIGRKLVAMAQDFPEDKFDFKPANGVRTFGEQLLHAAGSMYYFTYPAAGQNAKPDENPSRATYKTKADVVAFVKKAVEDGTAAIKARAEKGLGEVILDPDSKQQMVVSDMAYGIIQHSSEHYGQLVVYYRVAGLVPPESRKK